MITTVPLNRIPAFVSFSREHHFELLLIWKIRQGLKNQISAKRISEYIRSVHLAGLEKHFTDEETLLWDIISEREELRKKAEAEHAAIKHLLKLVGEGSADNDILQHFADALEAHIRFEERDLFNYLQEKLPGDHSLSFANRASSYNRLMDEQWDDPFWNHK
jgi:hypothetical protein